MKLLLTVQYISDRDSRIIDEVGFRIPRFGFRVPGNGFRIPRPCIPDSEGKTECWFPDSGFPYIGRNYKSIVFFNYCFFIQVRIIMTENFKNSQDGSSKFF